MKGIFIFGDKFENTNKATQNEQNEYNRVNGGQITSDISDKSEQS